MPKSATHNEILFRPPPGARFTIFGSDVILEFQRGREREVFEWLGKWLNDYVFREVQIAETPKEDMDPHPEISRLKAQIEKDAAERKHAAAMASSNNSIGSSVLAAAIDSKIAAQLEKAGIKASVSNSGITDNSKVTK